MPDIRGSICFPILIFYCLVPHAFLLFHVPIFHFIRAYWRFLFFSCITFSFIFPLRLRGILIFSIYFLPSWLILFLS